MINTEACISDGLDDLVLNWKQFSICFPNPGHDKLYFSHMGKRLSWVSWLSWDETWKHYTATNTMLEYTTDGLANWAKTDNKLKNLIK